MTAQEYQLEEFPSKKFAWKSIALVLVVILIVCALVAIGVVYLSPESKSKNNDGYSGFKITLKEHLSGNFSGKGIGARWISPGKLTFKSLVNDSIMLLTVNGSNVLIEELLQASLYKTIKPSLWWASPDATYIAFAYNRTKLYRYSGFAMFRVVDTKNDSNWYTINPNENGDANLLRVFSWNPVSGNNSFVFVYNNNVYYQESVSSKPIQVSKSGSKNGYIYNGVPDWLYEEEILGSDSAVWWSRDGTQIAYAEFSDDTDPFANQTGDVPFIQYPLYKDNQLYPYINKIPYSKCGEDIPTVKLMHWSPTSNMSPPTEIKPPMKVQNLVNPVTNRSEYYLFMVNWLSLTSTYQADMQLVVTWSNRRQNITFTTLCSVTDGQCYTNHEQQYQYSFSNGVSFDMWAIPTDFNVKYSSGQGQYFMILPQPTSDSVTTPNNVYNGISILSTNDNGTTRVVHLKTGNFDVQSIVGFNSALHELYFIAAAPLARNRHLYKLNINNKTQQCITCTMEQSMQCGRVTASFDNDGDTYLLSCNGPGRPRQWLKKMSTGEKLTLMNNNTALGAFLKTKALPVVHYTNVTINAEGTSYNINVKLEMPPGTTLSTTQKFPMIVYVYGGPGSQNVGTSYSMGFNQYLVSNRRYVIAYIDGRGSGAQGWRYKAPMYHRFGTVEIQDQISAAMQLQQRYSFIDKEKTGVWGWSYGGFATAHIVVADSAKFFKCPASVAPVTDFRYYDAAYTERYMGLPQTNPQGYAATSVINNATNFKDRNYLLAHGTGDDNVHFQNSVMLIKSLTAANVQFSLMIYPNQQHGISGDQTHIYTLLDNHFHSRLQSQATNDSDL